MSESFTRLLVERLAAPAPWGVRIEQGVVTLVDANGHFVCGVPTGDLGLILALAVNTTAGATGVEAFQKWPSR